jgi:two-component system OmpR family sensor kinase
MTGDPSIDLTELGPPRVGDPIDPNAELLGAPAPPGPVPPAEWSEAETVDAGAEPRSRRWHWGPRSLTGRLVTGVVALVAILVLATGAGTYFALRSFLINRLDQQLQATANGSLTRLFQGSPGAGQVAPVHVPQDVWAVALTSTGAILAKPAGTAVETMDLGQSASHQLSSRSSQDALTILTTDGHRLRVTVRRVVVTSFAAGTQVQGTAVIGLSTSEVDKTLHRLVVLEWIIGASALILAFGATFGGVKLSLRRLRRVSVTAHDVAAELSPQGTGLDRRVPVDDHDTTEVGQLAESMNTLLSAVETQFAARLESEQRMRQFLADASHELRTPLTSIRGYAELARMQRDYGDVGDPANLDRIESEGTRMSRLIDDLLLLARSDQSADADAPVVRELIDVGALLDDAVSGSRASFPARIIRLEAQPGLTVVGDPDQLVRAIRNLVNNAATHTRADGEIGVRAFRDPSGIVIQVADLGPGLPPEDAAHVFERFWRADKARTRSRGGSGLGMSIVASIVHAHGGSVRFDSSVAAGSTVTVWLPAGLV